MPYVDLYGRQIRDMTRAWGDAARRFIESSTQEKTQMYEALATHYQNAQATGDWNPMREAMRAMDPKVVQKFERTTGVVVPDEPTPQVATTARGLQFTPGKDKQVPWPSTFDATKVRQIAEQRKQPPDPYQTTLSVMELINKAPKEAQDELIQMGIETQNMMDIGRDPLKPRKEPYKPTAPMVKFHMESFDITPVQAMTGEGMTSWQLRSPDNPFQPQLPDIDDMKTYLDIYEGNYWREYKETGNINRNERLLPAEKEDVPGWERQLSIDMSRAYRAAGLSLDPNTALATMNNPGFDWEPYLKWVESQAGAVDLLRLIRAVPKENHRERERLMKLLADNLGYPYKKFKRNFDKIIERILDIQEEEEAVAIRDPEDHFRDIVIK